MKTKKDIFNSFMVEGATFSENDIPLCPSTTDVPPEDIITYREAVHIHRTRRRTDPDFRHDSFVCFYIDDCRFDGPDGIWANPKKAYDILRHFEGIIAPDFSTYADFPLPLKMMNYYRMNAFGYWYGSICRKKVIANVRWDYPDSFRYCFDGIRKGESIVALGTVASGLRKKVNFQRVKTGLSFLIESKRPKQIVVYGAMPPGIFSDDRFRNVRFIHYRSHTDRRLGGYAHE